MGCEFTIGKSDEVRVDHEKKSDGVKVDHEKKSDGVRVHHARKSDGVRVHHDKKRWGESFICNRMLIRGQLLLTLRGDEISVP